VDYNEHPLLTTRAETKIRETDQLVQADIGQLPFQKEQFDLIIGDFILYCLSPDKIPQFFQNIENQLTDDGAIFFSTHCGMTTEIPNYSFILCKTEFDDGAKLFLTCSFLTCQKMIHHAKLKIEIN